VTLAARFAKSALLFTLLAAYAGCARDVAVGHEDALEAAGGVPGVGGASANGEVPGAGGESVGGDLATGAAGGEMTSGGTSGGESGGALLWSADHEVASFDEWLGDGQGIRYEQGTGRLEISSEHAHSGSHAFTASLTTNNDGELHQAMMGRNIKLREGRYGAWFLLPEAPRADYWVIMKLSNGSTTDRFDLDIEALEGAVAHLRLFEHPNMWITDAASVEFPVGRWVHVEMLYRSTPSADGRLVVLQDGQQVLDSGSRVTASDDRVTFYCGSTSRSVTPSPFHLFIDDATVQAATLP
jgi:hypothetical protein